MAKVKISFSVDEKIKQKLDELRVENFGNMSNTMNTLFNFDNESLEKYIEIYNIVNNKSEKINFVAVSNGGLLTSRKYADLLIDLKVGDMKEMELSRLLVFANNIKNNVSNSEEISSVEKKEIFNTINQMKCLIVQQEERIEKLEEKIDLL